MVAMSTDKPVATSEAARAHIFFALSHWPTPISASPATQANTIWVVGLGISHPLSHAYFKARSMPTRTTRPPAHAIQFLPILFSSVSLLRRITGGGGGGA